MCSLAAHTFSLVNVYLRVLPILKVRLFALYPVVVFFFLIYPGYMSLLNCKYVLCGLPFHFLTMPLEQQIFNVVCFIS